MDLIWRRPVTIVRLMAPVLLIEPLASIFRNFLSDLRFCRLTSSSSLQRISIEMHVEMSKATKDKTRFKHRKQFRDKEKSNKFKNDPPSTVFLQVMGNGANGTPRALSVFTTHQRYLFNCGEGTQRIANEHKVRLSKLENIFITHKSWENLGGLAGLLLTIQDIGVTQVALHGPPRIEKLRRMMKDFMKFPELKIVKKEYVDPPFQDAAITVERVPIFSSQLFDIDWRRTKSPDCDFSSFESEDGGASTSSSPVAKRKRISSVLVDDRDISVAYICQLAKLPGALDYSKCIEFGVPVGPLLGKLKNGEDVTLPNGNVIKAKDVVEPDKPGPIFIVVECPNEDFLDSLLECTQFSPYQATTNGVDVAEIVVHFTPSSIIEHTKYQQWISRFSPTTQHLIINDACCGLANGSVFNTQFKLNLIQPDIFPLLQTGSKMNVETVGNITFAEPLLQYHLRPHTCYDRSFTVNVNPEQSKQEIKQIESWKEAYAIFKRNLNEKISKLKYAKDNEYPEIAFLGTGSSIPSKMRNVSSILIRTSEKRWLMLDCGEGTYGQILRLYGHEMTGEILRNLSCVFVSHLHADHHLGFIKILEERKKYLMKHGSSDAKVLYLLAPQQIETWLRDFHHEIAAILDQFILIVNQDIRNGFRKIDRDKYDDFLRHVILKELVTVNVIHCPNSFGVAFTHLDGWKLVYSGDTMPCDELVRAGKGCDILIHEATMEDDLLELAKKKTHSTTSQAIDIGRRMNAKFTMLTHFSQRYAKVPFFTDNFHSTVGVAFDNMKISRRNLELVPLFIPILKVLFSEDYEEMEDHRERMLFRRERQALNTKTEKTSEQNEKPSVKNQLKV